MAEGTRQRRQEIRSSQSDGSRLDRGVSQYAASCVASGAWSGSLPPSGFKTLSLTTQGTTNYHLVCSNSAASDQKDASVTVGAAPVLPPATAYRMTEAHDGVLITSTGVQYPPQSVPTWTRNLGAPVSYPLIANGMVFVATANPDGSYGNKLYALDAKTGATVWGPIAIAGTYFGSGLTYDSGRVFLLMFDGGVHAFNASNGGALWTAQLPGYWYDATPNAYGGIVFISGNAGLSAMDETSGTILWTVPSGGTTDWASPSVSSEGVYVQEGYACNAGAYDPLLGTALWQAKSQCDTPWGYASVIKDGIFFGRVGGSLNLFDAGTGKFKNQLGSARAPSVTDTAVITVNAGVLSSTRLSDLVQTWTFSGDGHLVTAPVVVNNTVFVGSGSGNVYGLDVGTGSQIWMGVSPAPINTDSENGGPMPPSSPAAGENLLIFVAGTSLVAWQLQ
jgi:outer membrane protein assembly factor BamB